MIDNEQKANDDLLLKLGTAYCHQCSEERQNTICKSPCPRQREIVAEHDAATGRTACKEMLNAILIKRREIMHDGKPGLAEFLGKETFYLESLLTTGLPKGKTESKLMYCPHCGTNSEVSTIRCQTEYPEFSIFTCYNCGKTHIRDVKEGLIVKALASHPLQNPDKSHYHNRFQEH